MNNKAFKITGIILVIASCSSQNKKQAYFLSQIQSLSNQRIEALKQPVPSATESEEKIAVEKAAIERKVRLTPVSLKVASIEHNTNERRKPSSVLYNKPRFLKGLATHRWTKDQLNQDPEGLKTLLENKIKKLGNVTFSEVQTQKGDTLQKISYRKYNTNRRWIEIFLLNTHQIKHYDHLRTGITLKLIE
jgi:nucleoid-associated protein YgaU